MSIQLNSDAYIPTQRLEIQKHIDTILDGYMQVIVEQTIVQEIKAVATAANMPQAFIENVKFKKTGANEGLIVNTWGTRAKPLAMWFNYGTRRHWIQPKTPGGVLAWKSAGGGSHGNAIYFQGMSKKGDSMFSKGHYVSGVPRTEAMEIGFRLGSILLRAAAIKIINTEVDYEQQ